jgi:hypothetical protein
MVPKAILRLSFNQTLDPRDKLLAADQPALDRGGERILWRMVPQLAWPEVLG